jgi:hypothetical protein
MQAFFLHPLPQGQLGGDNGEQSICRRRWPNSLTVSDDSEDVTPDL